jgi:hypothetical protein
MRRTMAIMALTVGILFGFGQYVPQAALAQQLSDPACPANQ